MDVAARRYRASVSATNHTNNIFRLIDLNPPAPFPPVVDPRDPRGQCWFGFVSQAQRLTLEFGTTPPPNGLRVLYSFDYDYFPGVGTVPPQSSAKPHGFLQLGTGPTDQDDAEFTVNDRSFVALWIDPTGTQPTTGQTVQVAVRARRQD